METLDAGLKILQEEVSRLKQAGTTTIPGDVVFRLYDTFGFPTDLTADIVRRDNLTIDEDGFQRAMEVQREKARESWKGSGEEAISALYQKLSTQGISTVFVGHEGVCNAQSQITALLQKEELVDLLAEGEEGELIVAETPFYGEIGGQIGDTGTIEGEDFVFEVLDTRRPLDNLISHVAGS
jgi:alanyl-tRNA synthetase